jgi:hypothetical protein
MIPVTGGGRRYVRSRLGIIGRQMVPNVSQKDEVAR